MAVECGAQLVQQVGHHHGVLVRYGMFDQRFFAACLFARNPNLRIKCSRSHAQ